MADRCVSKTDGYVVAVERIYDAATDPARWPLALQAIADCSGDIGANLTYRRDDGRFGVIVSPALMDGIEEYGRDWAHRDLRAQRIGERNSLSIKTVITDHDLVTPEEMATDPFYTEFLAKRGLKWFAVTDISPDPHVVAGLSLQRAAAKPPFSQDELETLNQLGRHTEKSLSLSIKVLDAAAENLGLRDTLGRMGAGVFVVDGQRRIIYANHAAHGMLGAGLTLADDQLICDAKAAAGRFKERLSSVCLDQGAEEPQPLLISRGDNAQPLAAYILPLRQTGASLADQMFVRARAIVLVFDTGRSASADPALVRDILGVSLGEARVASLIAAGLSPRDISAKLNVTEESVRTVLKRVFGKAGVSRQNELTALIAKLALSPR